MDDPDNVIWQVANRAFMKDHTYRLLPGGTIETISTFTVEDVRRTLSERILAGNLLITHAGPTNAADLEDILEETFARIPIGRSILQDVAPFVLYADTLVIDHDEVSTAFAVVKFNAPSSEHPDLSAFKVGMQAVDERLWQVLRTEHGLTYATYAGVSGYDQSWGYMYVSSPSPLEACSLMASVMAGAIAEPFDEEMIKGVIQLSRTYDGINSQNMNSQCYLMGWGWINTGDWRTAYMYTDIADGLNAEAVRVVLDRWIGFSGWGIIADTSLVREGELGPWSFRPMESDL
jgi:predicted Zn-dependent peptidase